MTPKPGFFAAMKKGDRVMLAIFALLLAVSLAAYLYRRAAPVPAGLVATVSINGHVVDTLRLDGAGQPVRRVYEACGGFNTVYADENGVAVVEADCPDHLCVKSGPINRPGSSVICLPHRFILRVEGGGADELDGGTY